MDSLILTINTIKLVVWYAVASAIIAVMALMLLRLILNYADLNPFSPPVLTLRSMTDPLINPVRRSLARASIDPKYSPLVVIIVAIVAGYFAVSFSNAVLDAIRGIALSIDRRSYISVVGYTLYGILSVYILLIFARIVFSWGLSSVNRLMLFLVRVTEPVLAPFRRLIPPLGMFDISPIVVLLLLNLLQTFIAGTLIR